MPKAGRVSDTPKKADPKDRPSKDTKSSIPVEEPFPRWKYPLPAECEFAVVALSKLHGSLPSDQRGSGPKSILDALVQTILSQNTTDVQSSKGFSKLKVCSC